MLSIQFNSIESFNYYDFVFSIAFFLVCSFYISNDKTGSSFMAFNVWLTSIIFESFQSAFLGSWKLRIYGEYFIFVVFHLGIP